MKKLLPFGLGLVLFLGSFTQSGNESIPLVDKNAYVERFYTPNELNKLGKGELTALYKQRLKVILAILPYVGLTQQPGAMLSDVGIPESSNNLNQLKDLDRNREKFRETVDASLDTFIPYSDTKDLKWAILFYEDIIKKASLGNDF